MVLVDVVDKKRQRFLMWTASPHDKRHSTDLDKVIGRRITLFRKAKDVSLQELARKIDLSYQQVQKYENGTNRISASRLYVIAKTLSANISDFFPEEFLHDKFMDDIYELEPQSKRLLMYLLQSSKEDQRILTSPILELLNLLSFKETEQKNQAFQRIFAKISKIDV